MEKKRIRKNIRNNTHHATLLRIRLDFLICLVLTAVTLAVYWQVTNHEFIGYDDPVYVTENRHIQTGLTMESIAWSFTTMHATNWHPLTWLSHILDVQIYGAKPGGHHLTNVLFHMANTLLLFFVLRRMTGALWRSAIVAALFALHPLHVESVAWVAERKDVLSFFFCMLAMWSYVRYVERPDVKRYLPVFFFFALGLMAKPMLVTLPFVFLLLDYWPLKRFRPGKSFDKHLILEKVPLFALSATSCVVTFFAQHSGGAVSSLTAIPLSIRVANALVSYVAYAGKMIWPFQLAVLYPHPVIVPWWQTTGAAVLLLSVSLLAVRAVKQHPYFAVGWLWYIGTLVPVIGLVQVGSQAMADRYTYIPIIGLFIIIVWGFPQLVERCRHKKAGFIATTAVILSTLTAVTVLQLQYWADNITLFERALQITASNYMIHYNLGISLGALGRTEEAISHFSEALRINPLYVDAHNNLGISLGTLGRTEEAISHFSEALRIDPFCVDAHNNLGVTLTNLGRTEEAISHYSKALRLKSDDARTHYNMGAALINKGRTEESIKHFSEAIRINPNFVEARNALKTALLIQKRDMHY